MAPLLSQMSHMCRKKSCDTSDRRFGSEVAFSTCCHSVAAIPGDAQSGEVYP